MDSVRFDIKAMGDASTDSQLRNMPSSEAYRLKRQMVQALLADRFGLKVSTETRTVTAYDMTLAKGGAKLQASTSNGKSVGISRTHFHGQGLTADLIAEELSGIAGRAVVDKTGLPDRYDVKLEWTPDDAPTTDSSAPSLFTAIQEQLGLKLTSAEEPLPVLVIHHVEQPSPN